MREADVAIRLRLPTQPDLIQRKLFTMHFHAYASPEYLEALRHAAQPRGARQSSPAGARRLHGPDASAQFRMADRCGPQRQGTAHAVLTINNVLGLLRACQRGLGVAMLPDYLVEENGGLVQLFGDIDDFTFDAFFVYPEELKSVARIQVFRDFLVAKAQQWNF